MMSASCGILNEEVEISKEHNGSHTQTGTELLQQAHKPLLSLLATTVG